MVVREGRPPLGAYLRRQSGGFFERCPDPKDGLWPEEQMGRAIAGAGIGIGRGRTEEDLMNCRVKVLKPFILGSMPNPVIVSRTTPVRFIQPAVIR